MFDSVPAYDLRLDPKLTGGDSLYAGGPAVDGLAIANGIPGPSKAPTGATGASKRSLSGSGVFPEVLLLRLLPPRPATREISMLKAIKMPNTIMTFSEVVLLLLAFFLAITYQVSYDYISCGFGFSDQTFSNISLRTLTPRRRPAPGTVSPDPSNNR